MPVGATSDKLCPGSYITSGTVTGGGIGHFQHPSHAPSSSHGELTMRMGMFKHSSVFV